MKQTIHLTAGILAGGKSTRMGSSKALLDWNGKTFLEHIIGLFENFYECLVSVDDKKSLERLAVSVPISVVVDNRQDYGPLEGIYQLLKTAKTDRVFVLATDMPLMEQAFLEAFGRIEMEEADIVIASGGGRSHPLCGIYQKSCIAEIEKLFWQEKHSIRELLEQTTSRSIEVESLGFLPELLANINTEAEYQSLLKKGSEKNACSNHNLQ